MQGGRGCRTEEGYGARREGGRGVQGGREGEGCKEEGGEQGGGVRCKEEGGEQGGRERGARRKGEGCKEEGGEQGGGVRCKEEGGVHGGRGTVQGGSGGGGGGGGGGDGFPACVSGEDHRDSDCSGLIVFTFRAMS